MQLRHRILKFASVKGKRAALKLVTAICVLSMVVSTIGQTVSVDSNTTLQTFRGWEAVAELGHSFSMPGYTPQYPSATFGNYKTNALNALLDLGINRIRLEWRIDDINASGYSIDSPFPDAIQPSTATSGQKHYDRIHQAMDAWVTDYRSMLAAQGESLWLTICVVDFRNNGYHAEDTATEYSTAVKGVVQDFYNSYGYLPNAIEPILEPDNSSGNQNWTTTKLNNAIGQLHTDLAALDSGGLPGYGNIKFVTPSVTSAATGTTWISGVSSNKSLISTYTYHRYGGNNTDVGNIWTAANSDSKETGMTEWIGATYLTLYDDITIGHISTWEQFTGGFPGDPTPTDDGGGYLLITGASPWTVTLGQRSKYLRHFFKYIRYGATRLGVTNGGGCTGVPFRNTNGTQGVVVLATGSMTCTVSGLRDATYLRHRTQGDGTNAPSSYDTDLGNSTVSGGSNVTVTFTAAGIASVVDTNFMATGIKQSLKGPVQMKGTVKIH